MYISRSNYKYAMVTTGLCTFQNLNLGISILYIAVLPFREIYDIREADILVYEIFNKKLVKRNRWN